jgi:hypothetical protein
MEDQPNVEKITSSKVYNELPEEFRKILDKACYTAFKEGYSEGYEDGRSGAEDHSKAEVEPVDLHTGRKWKGKESQSWKWV